MNKKAIIIGSGIAGIALSVRLKVKGYDVHVFEKNESYGGKLSEFKLGEYRYDFGPKLFTLPELLVDLFKISNQNIDDYIKYKKIEVGCKYFWEDGKVINAYADKQKLIKEIVSEFDTDKKKINNYLNRSKKKFDLTRTIFLEKSLHKVSTFFSISAFRAILNFFSLDILKPLNQLNEETFDDKKLVQLFNRFATYNGSNPFVTSGIMSMIQHLEHDLGVFMPSNGLSDISKSIYNLANDLGVTFSFNSNIDKIIINKNKAIGVEKNKQKYLADIVVSNMDVNLTYSKLLNGFKKPKYLKDYEPSSSAIVFYWNINKSFKELDLHNIIFSNNNSKEFDYIFDKKLVYEDPTIYICPTSKVVKNDAPEGCENWFILINSPHDSGQNWDEIKDTLRRNIIKKINKTLNVKIEKHILIEEVFTPKDIEIKTLSQYGSLYGSSSNSLMSAFLRHPNFSRKIKNLYFCGGSVHPGGGIPLCLNSAKIVSELIK
jgi:phytoene desaturase